MSLQRIGGGENNIPSLDINWEKVQKEIQATDDKYNTKPEQRLRLSKQTTGNMYSTKNQHKIDFLENDVPQPESKKAEVIDPNVPSRLNSIFDPEDRLQSNNSIRSAACHSKGVTDMGGPSKYIKSESSPSIWDNDKLTRLFDTQDSRDKVEEEKQDTKSSRQSMKDERLNLLVDGLSGTDQRKTATVLPAGDQSVSDDQSRFGKPTKNLSIFDFMGNEQLAEFSNLPKSTGGERVSQYKSEQNSQHDESWREAKTPVTSNGIVNSLFDSLMEGK
jgi:hypothetical protein